MMPGGSGETTVTSFVRGAMPAPCSAGRGSRVLTAMRRAVLCLCLCASFFTVCARRSLALHPFVPFFPVIYCTDGNFLATWTSGLCTASNVISVCALHFSLLPTGCCCSSFCAGWTVGASL